MSKLQLRSTRSRRRAASPSSLNGETKAVEPSLKKPKKAIKAVNADSDSSSDEFVRPVANLKVSLGGLSRRNGPSPTPDFSAIEQSIFSGVSRLSESESNDSDFEEVAREPVAKTNADCPKTEGQSLEIESSAESKTLSSQGTKAKKLSKATKVVKGKPVKEENKASKQSLLDSDSETIADDTENINKDTERTSRNSKKKSLEVPDNASSSSKDKVKKDEGDQEKKTASGRRQYTRRTKEKDEETGDQEGKKKSKNILSTQEKLKVEKLPVKEESLTNSDSETIADDTENIIKGTERTSKNSKKKSLEVPDNASSLPKGKVRKDEGNQEKKTASGRRQYTRRTKEKDEETGDQEGKKKSKNISSTQEKLKVEKLPVKEEVPESLDSMDVAQLLALGEGLKTENQSSLPSESESEDWEEVDPSSIKKHEIPKEGVQITLAAPEFSWRRKKQRDQQACIQAEMNRAFNRVRRELQLLCHKTSLLLWLAHGIFLNRVINSDSVKALALSLIPSDLSCPPKVPGRKYVDQLLKWFSKDFECSEGFPETMESSKSRPLVAVLGQHFSRRYAKSTRELTFMFLTTLRAVGVESRLVISFQPMPLKPQSDELLAINSKSKRGRPSNSETKDDCDDPEESVSPSESVSTGESSSKSSKNLKSVASPTQKKVSENLNVAKGSKPGKKSAPTKSNSKMSEETSKEKSCGRKSLPVSSKSPPKTRQLRRKVSEKKYKEETDSDNESSDDLDDPKPILSPDKKRKLDQDMAERLKAAAAKRLPPSKRTTSKVNTKSEHSKASGKSSQDSESDGIFEPKVKRVSQGNSSKSSASPQKSETKCNSRSTCSKPSTSPQKSGVKRRSKSLKSDSDSDSDFEAKPKSKQSSKIINRKSPAKRRQSKGGPSKSKGLGTKVLSSDDDSAKKQLTTSGSDYWVEVFLKDEERWTCVDVPSKKIDSTKGILAKATQPICYVIAYNADGTLKDVTKRYTPKYSQVTVKQRVSADWWEKTLKPFRPKHTRQEAAEDSEMNLVELDRPMPKTVAECKNHPLYVLKRHLLKFEAIYPADSPSLGFVRNEPLYARQNVYTLHSREIWMKDAKVVRLGEQPYKIVKARPKYDRLSGKVITDLPLEVFGPWQVEDYVPPPAKDGKVPRNAYGNVELFKPTMLPKGTVHLQVPGLTRVAKKLRIDCAPAVVGFDYHSGGCHPTYDGFVVCEEFVDVLMDAWNQDIDESAKRREEKHEKRVYGNWRRLIKGLMIREHLKFRYDFKNEDGDEGAGSSQSTVNTDALKASRIRSENAPLPLLFPKLMGNLKSQKTSQKKPSTKGGKNQPKSQVGKQAPKAKGKKRRKDETSEEEESDWDSTSTEEDDADMVLLSDEDSGSEFEDLKK